eukprot:COSAG02_NODE_1563_length_11913_cov_6.216438_6_plen_82_part_00
MRQIPGPREIVAVKVAVDYKYTYLWKVIRPTRSSSKIANHRELRRIQSPFADLLFEVCRRPPVSEPRIPFFNILGLMICDN